MLLGPMDKRFYKRKFNNVTYNCIQGNKSYKGPLNLTIKEYYEFSFSAFFWWSES